MATTNTTTANVTFKNLVNATIQVDNSADENRELAISADATIYGTRVDSIQNGQAVMMGDAGVTASFSAGAAGYLSVSYNNAGDVEQQVKILRAINGFIAGVKGSVPTLTAE